MDFEQFKMELFTVFSKYQPAIITAYLFGSTAKGMTTPNSDIDIALLLDSNDKTSGATLKFSIYADLCRTLKRNDIDLLLLNTSDNLILNDEIIRHGKVLYSTDNEAREKFELNVLHRSIDFKYQRHYAMGV
ncbi:MAG: nucleotidyltransferase domain-containing protein [Desulfuromonadaceae bacterium]|nr:nucleotidyltransferase domain-containing protein [Desulfuromonadaceae bacterium]MDD2854401.1 nucleotidyltransferase domain-containing protein [Desulfuromonadaceae bacterium]